MNNINSGLAHGTIGSPQTTMENFTAELLARQNEISLSSDLNFTYVQGKYVVEIKNEYLHNTIRVHSPEIGELTHFSLVHDDPILKDLNEQAKNLYASYYEFNSKENAYMINCAKENAGKEKMLSIIKAITNRLEEVNDGSLWICDLETKRLNNL